MRNLFTDDLGDTYRYESIATAPVISVTADNVTGQVLAVGSQGGAVQTGTSIKGTKWGRPDDTIGLAGAVNALSRDHRDFIAAGGLVLLALALWFGPSSVPRARPVALEDAAG